MHPIKKTEELRKAEWNGIKMREKMRVKMRKKWEKMGKIGNKQKKEYFPVNEQM